MSSPSRCAVHPVRRAVDTCPVCDRPRCAADAQRPADDGCAACGGPRAGPPPRSRQRERYVRAALAANGVALAGGYVAAEYVGAQLFAYLTPFVLGVLTGAAAQAAGGLRTGRPALLVRAIACLYALVGTALGFVLEASQSVFGTGALLPYAAALVGVLLWTSPPRPRR